MPRLCDRLAGGHRGKPNELSAVVELVFGATPVVLGSDLPTVNARRAWGCPRRRVGPTRWLASCVSFRVDDVREWPNLWISPFNRGKRLPPTDPDGVPRLLALNGEVLLTATPRARRAQPIHADLAAGGAADLKPCTSVHRDSAGRLPRWRDKLHAAILGETIALTLPLMRSKQTRTDRRVADPSDEPSLLAVAQLTEEAAETKQRTAKRAAEILVSLSAAYVVPTQLQRSALLVAFAQAQRVLYGKAFDIVRCPIGLDLTNPTDIMSRLEEVSICEIKSTNKASVKPKFSGYFFAITAGEMLTAQSLGCQYSFMFVNTRTRECLEMSLQQIFARSRGIYPTWSFRI
jgi:hypothetical protein